MKVWVLAVAIEDSDVNTHACRSSREVYRTLATYLRRDDPDFDIDDPDDREGLINFLASQGRFAYIDEHTLDEGMLSVDEVATKLRVSRMSVYRWCHSGQLPAMRLGRTFRITPEALHTFMEAGKGEAVKHEGVDTQPKSPA